jgi:hypothetical protein
MNLNFHQSLMNHLNLMFLNFLNQMFPKNLSYLNLMFLMNPNFHLFLKNHLNLMFLKNLNYPKNHLLLKLPPN